MKKINSEKSVFEPLENKDSKKADIVFNKLLGQKGKSKNPFDEIRSYTLPFTKEIKPGADDV